jgi:hypothetical protein
LVSGFFITQSHQKFGLNLIGVYKVSQHHGGSIDSIAGHPAIAEPNPAKKKGFYVQV